MIIIVCFLRITFPWSLSFYFLFFICNPCSKIFNHIEAFQFCFKVVVSIMKTFISFKKHFFCCEILFF
jgi:hypothetical protein